MIKVEKTEVWGFEHAIRGMRNPMNSWDKSDSYDAVDCKKCGLIEEKGSCKKEDRIGRCHNFEFYYVGDRDLELMNFWSMPCSLGADLSQGNDFCAFTFLFPLSNQSYGVKTRCYISCSKPDLNIESI